MMRKAFIVVCALMLTACSEISEGIQTAEQAVETGKQAIETGKQVVEAGKQLAESEVAQQLKTYLQQKYDSSEALRKAMFSGDGKLLTEELQKTELANFSFYKSDMFSVEYKGQLSGDGTFKVVKQDLKNPGAEPTVVKEFKVSLDNSGQVQVE
ncbi:hypothetical protein BRE01_29460 [Brevibacillus reuszeri]|uniref:Lipoprotein n=2 Tax=Brevibacillus reuszeri TaxID=54915 RepID=A0ABQ0TMY1_9BACL|nr:hypothetical protein [Brevibacillus reuszeri]MED1859025.1 hypothetical protein [Brevibacillus reuszeri]GED69244.1 hypothetical protein BRE01_29460 [Brevibacillus reuszeri]